MSLSRNAPSLSWLRVALWCTPVTHILPFRHSPFSFRFLSPLHRSVSLFRFVSHCNGLPSMSILFFMERVNFDTKCRSFVLRASPPRQEFRRRKLSGWPVRKETFELCKKNSQPASPQPVIIFEPHVIHNHVAYPMDALTVHVREAAYETCYRNKVHRQHKLYS